MLYMVISHHQTTGQNHCIKVANKSFENVAKFKCWGATGKIKLHSGRNSEHTKFEECVIYYSSEYFAFPSDI
jgi:hypothetical protein